MFWYSTSYFSRSGLSSHIIWNWALSLSVFNCRKLITFYVYIFYSFLLRLVYSSILRLLVYLAAAKILFRISLELKFYEIRYDLLVNMRVLIIAVNVLWNLLCCRICLWVIAGIHDFVNILFDFSQELFVLHDYFTYTMNVLWLILGRNTRFVKTFYIFTRWRTQVCFKREYSLARIILPPAHFYFVQVAGKDTITFIAMFYRLLFLYQWLLYRKTLFYFV